ncbi:MAG: DUF5131 family protein [Novosphingobium sp.]
MSDNTAIEWTDATWNPITGCSVISPGCTNCYAMKLAGTRLRHHESRAGLTRDTKAGPVWTGETRLNKQWLTQPLRWKRPRRIFVCAHGDLFHESVPDEWIDRVFAVMGLAPQHTFQVLTKRSKRMREYVTKLEAEPFAHTLRRMAEAWPHPISQDMIVNGPNVWLGVSVEDQQRADERIPDLLATPAAIRFLSCEPLLGPVDLGKVYASRDEHGTYLHDAPVCALDWVIVGGESGHGARPMEVRWASDIVHQCRSTGVPVFVKQLGSAVHGKAHKEFDAFPADLRVREFPA